jgi:hypothetical protein
MMQPVALAQQLQNLKNLLTAPPHFLILQGFGTGNLAVNAELMALFDEFLLPSGFYLIIEDFITFFSFGSVIFLVLTSYFLALEDF